MIINVEIELHSIIIIDIWILSFNIIQPPKIILNQFLEFIILSCSQITKTRPFALSWKTSNLFIKLKVTRRFDKAFTTCFPT